MADVEFDDVLSSIRRLVSDEDDTRQEAPAKVGRLILTPALRVDAPPAGAPGETAEPGPAGAEAAQPAGPQAPGAGAEADDPPERHVIPLERARKAAREPSPEAAGAAESQDLPPLHLPADTPAPELPGAQMRAPFAASDSAEDGAPAPLDSPEATGEDEPEGAELAADDGALAPAETPDMPPSADRPGAPDAGDADGGLAAMERAWAAELARIKALREGAPGHREGESRPDTLESRIAQLEAAVNRRHDEWEPDGSEPEAARPVAHRIFDVVENLREAGAGAAREAEPEPAPSAEAAPGDGRSDAAEAQPEAQAEAQVEVQTEASPSEGTDAGAEAAGSADAMPSGMMPDVAPEPGAEAFETDTGETDTGETDTGVTDAGEAGEAGPAAAAEQPLPLHFRRAHRPGETPPADESAAGGAAAAEAERVSEKPVFSHARPLVLGQGPNATLSEASAPDEPPAEAQAAATGSAADAPVSESESEPASEPEAVAPEAGAELPADIPDEGARAGEIVEDDDVYLDLDSLRDMITEVVRDELRGRLGETITRNVRRMVRQEIRQALIRYEDED